MLSPVKVEKLRKYQKVLQQAPLSNLEMRLEPSNTEERYLCNNQKFFSTDYTSFSTFGLFIIFSVGGLTILASYIVEPLISYIQRRLNLNIYARLEWCANETLQLQRLAHEELGLGGEWRNFDGVVPVTGATGQYLAVVDLKDVTHPRLKAPPKPFDEELVVAELESGHQVDQMGEGRREEGLVKRTNNIVSRGVES